MTTTPSLFIQGMLNEDRASLAYQIGIWHHLTIVNVSRQKINQYFSGNDQLNQFLEQQSQALTNLNKFELMTWKFNETLSFLKLPKPTQLTTDSLHQLGYQIEQKTTALLQQQDSDFNGKSIEDVAHYLFKKTFINFTSYYKKQNDKTQQAVAEQILEILHTMPDDQQDFLKQFLHVDQLTPDIIHFAIMNESLGNALTTLVKMLHYTAYYFLIKVSIVATTFVAVAFHIPLLSGLAPLTKMIFNPLFIASAGVGLTWLTEYSANQSIQNQLLPIMVMNAILAIHLHSGHTKTDSAQLEQHFITYYNQQ